MLIVISPAKNLDFESPLVTPKYSQSELLNHSRELMKVCRTLTPADLASLMKISDKLAGLNVARFTQWKTPFSPENARPAVLAFNGEVYAGLNAPSFSEQDFDYAQNKLRILSGLYGLLKPLDLIQPYRLEMGTSLANERGSNLYQFWGDVITKKLNDALKQSNSKHLIHLASNEYFKAVKSSLVKADIITPVFKDYKNGQYKIISFFAKKARGLMARYIIDNRIENVEQLKNFNSAGYQYDAKNSTATTWVFTREEQTS